MRFQRRVLGLCLLPAVLTCLDGGLTLIGQSNEYWAGNYMLVREGSPMFGALLAHHPLAFVAGVAGWIVVFSTMMLLLPQTLALITSLAVTMGHLLGVSSWLPKFFHQQAYPVFISLCFLTAVGLGLAIRWGWRAEPQSDSPAGVRLPWALRWVVIAALSGVAACMFLWPQKP